MRKILLLLLLIGSTFSANAQLFGYNWKEGYYIDLRGRKHLGFIADYVASKGIAGAYGSSFRFKYKDEDSKKIKAKDVRAFVVKPDKKQPTLRDSFIVATTNKLSDAPFLLVKINNNPVKLYSSVWNTASPGGVGAGFSVGISWSGETYYWGTGPDDVTKLTKKNFVEAASQFFADKPDIVAKITDKTYGWSDRENLIRFYLTGKWNEEDKTSSAGSSE
ncbi:hypothetical protein EOD41_11720 [Mucilaginibacter limnophilus]|uniref:Uncharacterized protein n=1 Tax=Mucilaginibacter limnophilus TaxID=1932778 RepID=A0A437MSM6_9SPHI|nr:hypothetical protein [Mucilaginibacter limnophilus]RVU00661.1 hypothetical protein EOD41_11720 [Mucilaginibacter limnophilus]